MFSELLINMLNIVNLKDVPEYLEILAQWHHQQWSYLNPGETLQQRIARMQVYLNGDDLPSTFIALADSLSGSAALVNNDMVTRPELSPWLASVYVHPQYRCRGIGSALVSHVMTQAQLIGIETLYLFTPDKQLFYRKRGWQLIENERYHDHEVSIMRARLNKINLVEKNQNKQFLKYD